MSVTTCPNCAGQIREGIDTCPNCGSSVKFPKSVQVAPIGLLSGKFQAFGIVLIAASVIAMALGAWWGPALLFPSVIVFIMGRLF